MLSMRTVWLLWLACFAGHAFGQASSLAEADKGFVEDVYPQFRAVQCHLCHNDNGVASEYGLTFPPANASAEQILAFGYQLADQVDLDQPASSALLLKPTGRVEHTGGVRIPPGSDAEQKLEKWVKHLATLTPPQRRQADELIQRANQWQREPLSLQRLTHSQYNRTVHDLLGDQSQPANQFPKEDFIRGFKNQLEGQSISPLQAEAYSQAAERLANVAFRAGDLRLLPTKPATRDDQLAATEFVRSFGQLAFRRPLTDAELTKYTQLLIRAATSPNDRGRNQRSDIDAFVDGARLVIEAMLQSPHFLYRRSLFSAELASGRSQLELDPYAVASRLSYTLWDTLPDAELFKAAESNQLGTREQLNVQIRRMVADPRAEQGFHEFLSQWLRFDRVLTATRDRRRYREFNLEIASAMVEETTRLFDHLVQHDQNFMEFYTADYTFVNAPLARLYGIPEPASDFEQVSYPAESGRSGVLGHGTFLVSTSKPAETSPTARGLFVRNHLLAQEIAPPPPGVNSVLPEIAEDRPLTNRQRLEVHLNSEACASCHRLVDPIGYAFEQYDAIGAFHQKVQFQFGTRDQPVIKELEVDTTAYIQGLPNSQFSQPKELGKLLAESETCQRCLVKQYFRYVMGREETLADARLIDTVHQRFRESGFRFREMVVALLLETSLPTETPLPTGN